MNGGLIRKLDTPERVAYWNHVDNIARQITSKHEMYRLLQSGRLGNTVPSWNLGDIPESEWPSGHVGIRSKRPLGFFVKTITLRELKQYKQVSQPPDNDLVYYFAPPEQYATINGEIAWGSDYPEMVLRYNTTQPLTNRTAMRSSNAIEVTGLRARMVLAHFVWERDLEALYDLLDTYVNAVVEFTSYSVPYGTIPGCNTIIWEVRNY